MFDIVATDTRLGYFCPVAFDTKEVLLKSLSDRRNALQSSDVTEPFNLTSLMLKLI